MRKGFTLIELLTTVAIIGILMLMAYPAYRNYILRVRMIEIVHNMTNLIKDGQIAYGTGELISVLDIDEIVSKYGLPRKYYGCIGGVKKVGVDIPKQYVQEATGMSAEYITQLAISGFSTETCTGTSSNDASLTIYVSIDTDTLGLGNKSGNKNYNYLELAVSDAVIYKSLSGETINRSAGSVLSCGIYPAWGGGLRNYDVPYYAIPQVCRYYNKAGATPRTLIELTPY
ncbi:MAG: type IV pilin protein [Wohlfahrtiimonas sp.]